MQHDAWFFIGVFVFIFLIWAATGGPVHPLSFSGPRLALPGALGGGTYLSLPRAPFQIGDGDYSLPDSSGSSYGGGNSIPSNATLSGTSFGTPSPYRGQISLDHYISGAGSLDPNKESIRLRVSAASSVPVDLTGWTIVSETTGKSATLPKGTELPASGTINPIQDIILLPGQDAIISSGRSPIGGSFRENKCIGYYGQYQTFSPSLANSCPEPTDEMMRFYQGYISDVACIDYTKKLSRCQVALTPPANATSGCSAFLVKYLNYNGCVDAHKSDANFEGSTWRIYLGRTAPLWRTSHEVVKLLDKQGKTVDAFAY